MRPAAGPDGRRTMNTILMACLCLVGAGLLIQALLFRSPVVLLAAQGVFLLLVLYVAALYYRGNRRPRR